MVAVYKVKGCGSMRIKTFAILLFGLLVIAGCSNDNEAGNTDKVDIKQMVEDYTLGTLPAASASITSSELIVTDENQVETIYDLPDEEFFVSIAPFKTETHPCDIHSLTGCQGELVDVDVAVLVEDLEGNVILDETRQTEANGFIDIWLPRDETFKVTMTQDGLETTAEISTFDGDNTCITTMQLT